MATTVEFERVVDFETTEGWAEETVIIQVPVKIHESKGATGQYGVKIEPDVSEAEVVGDITIDCNQGELSPEQFRAIYPESGIGDIIETIKADEIYHRAVEQLKQEHAEAKADRI